MATTNSLAKYLTLDEYRAERPSIFPSLASLKWFVRQKHDELVAAEALVKIAGQILLNPETTDAQAIQYGLAMARGEKPIRAESRKPAAPPSAPGEPPRRGRGRPRKSEATTAAV